MTESNTLCPGCGKPKKGEVTLTCAGTDFFFHRCEPCSRDWITAEGGRVLTELLAGFKPLIPFLPKSVKVNCPCCGWEPQQDAAGYHILPMVFTERRTVEVECPGCNALAESPGYLIDNGLPDNPFAVEAEI